MSDMKTALSNLIGQNGS